MNSRIKQLLFGLWILLAIIGSIGIVERLIWGHQLAAYGSYVIWGLWVSAYIYFVGLSAGVFLLASLIYVFRVKKIERIGKLALFTAIITLMMGLGAIWFDLGKMSRVAMNGMRGWPRRRSRFLRPLADPLDTRRTHDDHQRQASRSGWPRYRDL